MHGVDNLKPGDSVVPHFLVLQVIRNNPDDAAIRFQGTVGDGAHHAYPSATENNVNSALSSLPAELARRFEEAGVADPTEYVT